MNRQWFEAASWRVAVEVVRRYPELSVFEMHPGGGQYDCLWLAALQDGELITHIDLNRVGSAHFHFRGGESWGSFWADLARAEDPVMILDQLCDRAGLPPVKQPPPTTPRTLTYRVIAAFLSHAVGGRPQWECRSGYLDSSGVGECGVRGAYFEKFPGAGERLRVRESDDLLHQPAYRFWFLLKDDEPRLALEVNGTAWDLRGRRYDLPQLYRGGRRVWPVVFKVAGDLLP